MDKYIKYFNYDNSIYIMPQFMPLKDLVNELKTMGKLAVEAMNKEDAAHAIYAVERYNLDGEIEQVNIYNPPVCLDNKDFYERTEAEMKEHPGCIIYAIHKKS